ncbi:MAG TPA: HPr family phosphocarrier protein [Anaerovoracaceae bacterium]|nr:HPr family phosphocarrier protein [Anaerovoracaceae bacterium]
MITKKLTVLNELGIHARVASRIVRCASGFESSINVKKEGGLFDLKTVLGVMTLNAKCGESLLVEIEGSDETEAANTIEELFAIKFGEN